MCEKCIRIWTCGCTRIEDPRPCYEATKRNKPCDGYGFAWAYRDPIPTQLSTKCPSCEIKDEVAAKRKANEAYVANSEAYPTLKTVENEDDSRRIKAGRPKYDRMASGTELAIPSSWTSEMNRLPSNANEFSAFLTGAFNPSHHLPDTHIPRKATNSAPQDMIAARGCRLRLPPPPSGWQGAVLLDEDDYPYVEFRGPLTARPDARRRPSYTGNKLDKGWLPPSCGTLPPQHDVDTEPPSRVPSPKLKVMSVDG